MYRMIINTVATAVSLYLQCIIYIDMEGFGSDHHHGRPVLYLDFEGSGSGAGGGGLKGSAADH